MGSCFSIWVDNCFCIFGGEADAGVFEGDRPLNEMVSPEAQKSSDFSLLFLCGR